MRYQCISSDRLFMEPAETVEASVREMIGWLNDPVTMQYSEQRHQHHTIDSQREYICSFTGENLLLAVYHERVMIGTVSIYVDIPNDVVDVGILIGSRSHWGAGLGFEAWKAVCDSQFERNRRKAEAGCMAINKPMMSICSRYGMLEEGRQENHFLVNGSPVDLVHWGIFK